MDNFKFKTTEDDCSTIETCLHFLKIKNYLFFIITEYEFAVVTRKKDLLLFAIGQRTADTKRILK